MKHICDGTAFVRVKVPPPDFIGSNHWVVAQSLDLENNMLKPQDYSYLNLLAKKDMEPFKNSEGTREMKSSHRIFLFTPIEGFDFCLLPGPEVEPVFPSASSRNVMPGDPLFVCSYPGQDYENVVKRLLKHTYHGHPKQPTYHWTKKVFHGFGKQCASCGFVLAVNDTTLSYDCSLFSGSTGGTSDTGFITSAGFVKSFSDHTNTFTAIHQAGHFDLEDGVGYNCGYFAHHPGLVVMYAKFVYPRYKPTVPNDLMAYFVANKSIIKEHSGYIDNDLSSILG